MAEDLFEDTNLKVYHNQELIYEKLKENTINKMNILENRIEKILELNENILYNDDDSLQPSASFEAKKVEATLLLFQSVKSIYQELLLLKEDINVLKEASKENINN